MSEQAILFQPTFGKRYRKAGQGADRLEATEKGIANGQEPRNLDHTALLSEFASTLKPYRADSKPDIHIPDLYEVVGQMLDLWVNSGGFVDREWSEDATIVDLFRYLDKQISRMVCIHYSNYETLEDGSFSRRVSLQLFHNNFCWIAIGWITDLPPKIRKLAMQVLAHYKWVNDWEDMAGMYEAWEEDPCWEYNECLKNGKYSDQEEADEMQEHITMVKEVTQYYKEGLPAVFLEEMNKTPQVDKKYLRKKLQKYNHPKYKDVKEWLLEGLDVAIDHPDKCIYDYAIPKEDEFDDSPVDITEAYRFIWVWHDNVQESYSQWVDERCGNWGLQEIEEFEKDFEGKKDWLTKLLRKKGSFIHRFQNWGWNSNEVRKNHE